MKLTPYALTYAPNFKWMELPVEGSRGGKAWVKVLGKDPEDGAAAALVKYDAGFELQRAKSPVFSDSLLIEGRMRLGDDVCRRLSYHYRPAGVEYGPILAEEETIRFVIIGGRGEAGSEEPVFIANVEGDPELWEPSELGSGYRERVLRIDEVANVNVTYRIANAFLVFKQGRMWVNKAIQEAYCVDGAGWDFVGEVDGFVALLPGTYIHRPANETFHGSAMTFQVPRRLFVKYYDADPKTEFELAEEQDLPPVSFPE